VERDGVEWVEPYGTDALAATRRAITEVAAELAGRQKPNAQADRAEPSARSGRAQG